MSYFSGTFPKKFCRSDDHRPSNQPEPLHNDFWDTLYVNDHGQNFQIAVVKWSKFMVTFDHDHGQNLRINVVKRSKLVSFDHRTWAKSRVSWSTFLTIDHRVNSRVSWSWSVPCPPPPPFIKITDGHMNHIC